MVVDSGKFDWQAHADKFPGLTTPDDSYHGIVYTEQFGSAAYITKCRTHLMRDMGVAPSPQNAFLLSQGIDTLHLRMERHCSNAQKVAEYLSGDDRRSPGSITPACPATKTTPWRKNTCLTAPAASSPSALREDGRQPAALWRR